MLKNPYLVSCYYKPPQIFCSNYKDLSKEVENLARNLQQWPSWRRSNHDCWQCQNNNKFEKKPICVKFLYVVEMGERHGKIFLNKNAFFLNTGIGLSTLRVEPISIEVCQRTNVCVPVTLHCMRFGGNSVWHVYYIITRSALIRLNSVELLKK
jgi:hypothetical protein